MPTVHLLDYVAGNIRSLVNAIEKVGYTVEWVKSPQDVEKAEVCLVLKPQFHNISLTLLSASSSQVSATSATASPNSTALATFQP